MPDNLNENTRARKTSLDWDARLEQTKQALRNYSSEDLPLPKPVGKPYSQRKKYDEETKALYRKSTQERIAKQLATALDDDNKYYSFVQGLGYSSMSVPAFHRVESITLEGDNLCINEIPEDKEDNDTESDIE